MLLYSLEQLDGLSSEAGQASVQHERYQGDHRVHVGPDAPQEKCVCYLMLIFKNRLVKTEINQRREQKAVFQQ